MDSKFSQKIKDILTYSREEAIRLGNNSISPEHLFLGILRDGESVAIDVLISLGLDLPEIKHTIERKLITSKDVLNSIEPDELSLYKSSERALKLVFLEARSLKTDVVNPAHLLLAILKDENNFVTQLLLEKKVDYSAIRSELEVNDIKAKSDFSDEDDERTQFGTPRGGPQQTPGKPASDTPVLDNFGIDLTKAAEEGRLDPIIGREREIERIAQRLAGVAAFGDRRKIENGKCNHARHIVCRRVMWNPGGV